MAKSPTNQCTICHSKHVKRINADLVAGKTVAGTAREYTVSEDALRRHKTKCIPRAIAAAAPALAADAAEHGQSLADSAASLRAKALELLARAEKAGDLRTALTGVREAARCLHLQAEIVGEIDNSVTVNVAIAPAMQSLMSAVMACLAAHPAARQDLVVMLGQLDDPNVPMIEGSLS